jgi:hypothetical protein
MDAADLLNGLFFHLSRRWWDSVLYLRFISGHQKQVNNAPKRRLEVI